MRSRPLLIATGVLVVVAIAMATLSGGNDRQGGTIDPENPAPAGAQALAEVLRAEGVEVSVVRSADAFDDSDLSGAMVLVTGSSALTASSRARLLAHAGSTRVLVVGIDDPTDFAPDGTAIKDAEPTGPVPAQCDDRLLTGLEIATDYTVGADTPGCFPTEGGNAYADFGNNRAFFGSTEAWTNRSITRADNAAVALRLLGQQERLVWYVPTWENAAAGDEVPVRDLLPPWLGPGIWLGVFTLIGLMFWRGRRLGPVISEPLPVRVKAIETTLSHARLYRRGRDHAHAASTLRAAALTQARTRLNLPREAPAAQVVEAATIGHPTDRERLSALLLGPLPEDEPGLIRLAQQLQDFTAHLDGTTPDPGADEQRKVVR